jgi:hypothetical protein
VIIMKTRQSRLEEYADPNSGWHGCSRDGKYIERWIERASANSQIAPRARDGEVKLPSTGKKMELRDTEMRPRVSRSVDARMVDKGDKNHVGDSSYMRGVRRAES